MLQKTLITALKNFVKISLFKKIGLGLRKIRTVRIKTQKEFEKSDHSQAQQMEQIYRALYGVIHEIRAPLAGLKMACGQLAQDPGNHKLVLTLSTVFPQQVDKLLRQTTAVLKYCKEFSTALELLPEQVDLLEFLKEPIAEFETNSASDFLNYKVDTQEDAIPLWVDREQLKQALVHVLENSVEACSERSKGEVKIKVTAATTQNPYVEISIIDNGSGIPDEVRESLFDPFVSYGKKNNVGLGLTFSKRIIEAHRGTLQGMNNPGGGARFSIRLPK